MLAARVAHPRLACARSSVSHHLVTCTRRVLTQDSSLSPLLHYALIS